MRNESEDSDFEKQDSGYNMGLLKDFSRFIGCRLQCETDSQDPVFMTGGQKPEPWNFGG